MTLAAGALLLAVVGAAVASAPRFDAWKIVGPGGGGGHFHPTISPHDTRRVLVACDMTGSFITHDSGQSWRMFHLGNRTDLFAFDPSQPDTIYAKTGGPPSVMSKDRPVTLSGLFRSADAGKTWRLVRADDPASGSLIAFAVDPKKSDTLFAVIGSAPGPEQLFISTDRGTTWKPNGALASGSQAIFVDPHSPSEDRTLYIVGSQAITIRQSGKWTTGASLEGRGVQFAIGFPKQVGAAIVYATHGSGVSVSEDGGRTWRKSEIAGITNARLRAVATSLHHPGAAYVSYSNSEGGWHGVAKTVDQGKTWSLVWKESNTAAANVQDAWLSQRFSPRWGGSPGQLGVAPNDPNICYGTDSGRTMRTLDGGATWQGVYSRKQSDEAWNTTGLDVTTAYGVHFDPFDSRRMFISYTDIGLFGSENGGKTWFSATTGVPQRWTNTTYWIAFDPEVRGKVWGAMAGAHDLPRPKMWLNRPKLEYPGGVCRSSDGGKTWTTSNQGMPLTAATHIVLDPKSPKNARTLYATGFATGVYKSIDDGATWSLKNKGIEGSEPFAWRITLDPANGTLYLVVARRSDDGSIGGPGDGALYRSTDGAESWTRVALPAGVNGPHGLALDPADSRKLYLAAWGRRPDGSSHALGGGIYVSNDAGATWKQVLDRDAHIYDITVDTRNPRTLYASGFGASAWRSDDRGEHWSRLGGFNFKWGHRVIPDPLDTSKIYVTTYGGSVWHGPAKGDPNAAEDVVRSR